MEGRAVMQRKLTSIQTSLLAALNDPNTDPKTRSVIAAKLGELEIIQRKIELLKARKSATDAAKADREKKKNFGI
jgi:hypothetical protein